MGCVTAKHISHSTTQNISYGTMNNNVYSLFDIKVIIREAMKKGDKKYIDEFLDSIPISTNFTRTRDLSLKRGGKPMESKDPIRKFIEWQWISVDDFICLTEKQVELYLTIKKMFKNMMVEYGGTYDYNVPSVANVLSVSEIKKVINNAQEYKSFDADLLTSFLNCSPVSSNITINKHYGSTAPEQNFLAEMLVKQFNMPYNEYMVNYLSCSNLSSEHKIGLSENQNKTYLKILKLVQEHNSAHISLYYIRP